MYLLLKSPRFSEGFKVGFICDHTALFDVLGAGSPRNVVDQNSVLLDIAEVMILDGCGLELTAKVAKQPRGCGDDVVARVLMDTGDQVFPVILDLNVEVVGVLLPSVVHWDV
jgi:hypothetical protein